MILWTSADIEPPVSTEYLCKVKGLKFTDYAVCKWDGEFWLIWNYFGKDAQGWFGLNPDWEVLEWTAIFD